MKHRDRVTLALSHGMPDRCPMQVGFTPELAARLRIALGITGEHGDTYELERALDQDMLLTSVGWVNGYYQAGYQHVDSYRDQWGVVWKTVEYETRFGKGKYTEPFGHPLANDRDLVAYTPPDPNRAMLYAQAEQTVRDHGNEYWIVGVTPATIFECAWALRGFQRLLKDMVSDPDRANCVLDFPFRYHAVVAQRLVQLGVDMLWLGDDVGGQTSMLISPTLWRKYLKPRLAELITSLKAINPGIKVAYHTDGVAYPIIPELIEIGVDVLNPVQPRAMDPARLKREYGDRLCFWGSIDIQQTMPFGTPQDVEDEVLLRLRTIGRNGGLLIGPTHNLQLDTPLENFWAMMRAIRETPYSSLA